MSGQVAMSQQQKWHSLVFYDRINVIPFTYGLYYFNGAFRDCQYMMSAEKRADERKGTCHWSLERFLGGDQNGRRKSGACRDYIRSPDYKNIIFI